MTCRPRRRWFVALLAAGLAASACTGSSGKEPTPSPSGPESALPTAIPPIPDGTYTATISLQDAEGSPNAHIINLATQLAGRYMLTLRRGTYTLRLDGRISVPTPIAVRTGGEGAYARYGFWLFLGVPPIGRGVYGGDSNEVAFRSKGGACFQAGARSLLTTGVYRWALQGNSLSLRTTDAAAGAAGSTPTFKQEGCLGRGFVLTAHPWVRET
jgi:hypothetical protein